MPKAAGLNKEQIVDMAVRAAINYLEEKRKKERKSRHDRRLRNTRLLLKHYNILKEHSKSAIYSSEQAEENALDILDSFDEYGTEVYIEAIKKSTVRTQVILAHVDEMLKLYKLYCDNSDKPEDQRRYRVIIASYVQGMKIPDICKAEEIDKRTYYRDTNASIETLSSFIFGVDWFSSMSQT